MAGRVSMWEKLDMPNKLILVEGWARDGATDKQIAEFLGVSEPTLIKWKKEFPEFKEVLAKGKEVIDRQVENALLRSATGFEYEEDAVTNKGSVVKVKKYEKPNTTAQIFWLKNRKRDVWTDKQEHEIKTSVLVDEMTPEEREQRIKELMSKVDSNKESGE